MSSDQDPNRDEQSTMEEGDAGKRLRTEPATGSGGGGSAGFLVPGVAASPPRFLSLEEVMQAANGVSNMALAHHIAIDDDFKLQKQEVAADSVVGRVKEMMHKAFWDLLQQQLDAEPPDLSQALSLLGEVKQTLLSLLLPQHTQLRRDVQERLDETVIKQQAEAGTLQFGDYSSYVLSVMSRICAPVRDDNIRELGQRRDVVATFRGIMETLELMRIDMANFTIRQVRPYIVAQSVEYERKKFAEYLQTTQDGLLVTRAWLERGIAVDAERGSRIHDAVTNAYLEFMDWPEDAATPETLAMDWGRLREQQVEVQRLIVIGAALLVTYGGPGQPLQTVTQFRKELKQQLTAIVAEADSVAGVWSQLGGVAAQCVAEVRRGLQTQQAAPPSDQQLKHMSDVIEQLNDPTHGLRQLITRRVREFLRAAITSTTAQPLRVPAGLSSLAEELARVGGQLLRLVTHNRAVFGDHYTEILERAFARKDREAAAADAGTGSEQQDTTQRDSAGAASVVESGIASEQ